MDTLNTTNAETSEPSDTRPHHATVVGRARSLASHVVVALSCVVLFDLLSWWAAWWAGDVKPSPLWLATAAVSAIGLSFRNRRLACVVGVLVGGIVSSRVQFHESWSDLVGPVVANTVEVAAVVTVLPRALGWSSSIRRTHRAFLALVVMIGAAALSGAIVSLIASSAVADRSLDSWGRWTLGDFAGMTVVLPLVYAARADWLAPRTRGSVVECISHTSATIGLVVASFTLLGALTPLAVTFVVWVALRFGPLVSAPLVAVVVLLVSRLTVTGHGPLSAFSGDVVVNVQWFNIAIASGTMVVAAFSTRAWDDHRQLVATIESLPDLVVVRDSSTTEPTAWGNVALLPRLGALPPPGEPGVSLIDGVAGETIERRVTRTSHRRTLELFRDVSAEQALSRLRDELEARVQRSREQSRADVAQQLHDGPLQAVVAARMFVAAEVRSGGFERAGTIEQLLGEAGEGLRGVLLGLEADLPARGQSRRCRQRVRQTCLRWHRGPVRCRRIPTRRSCAPCRRVTMRRCAYAIAPRGRSSTRALHSGCSTVEAVVDVDPRSWTLAITDDGIGLRPDRAVERGHRGLIGMHTRELRRLGGHLDVARGRRFRRAPS